MNPPRALIADDEALLAEDLRRRLASAWPELEIAATVADGVSARSALAALRPEIAFLDIRMPGLSGLEVARQIDFPCRVVFVTAYDQYAVEAFERAAVDYLLKPVSDERLASAVARLRQPAGLVPPGSADPTVRAVVEQLLAATGGARPERVALKWIRASLGNSVRLVPIDEVCYFEAADKYTRVVTAQGELLIRTPIRELLTQLDPETFWQIHRGTIVNARHVTAATVDANGRTQLKIAGRSEVVAVSRAYAYLFRQM